MPRCLKNICVDMSLPGIEQVAFSKIKGITPETAGAILAAVGSEAEFFRMSERELAELASAGSHIFAAFEIQRLLIVLLGHFHQGQQIKLMLRQFIHIFMRYIGRNFLFH